MQAFTGAKILTMAGQEFPKGAVLVEDGKIVAVGDNFEIPGGCEVVDVTGMVILPGFIDVHCHIGAFEDGIDDANEMTAAKMPGVRVLDAINPHNPDFAEARAAGFTMVLVHPGSGNVLGGQSVLLKTFGTVIDDMVVKQPAGMKFAFGGNPKRPFRGKANNHPRTRMGVAATFRQALFEAREYADKRKDDPKMPFDMGLEALSKLFTKEIKARVHVGRSDDIMTVIRLCKEFDIDFTLEHVTEGHLVADEIAESGAPCVVGPMFSPRGASETRNLTFQTPGILARRGIKVALTVDHPVVPLSHSIYQTAVAVKAGMDPQDALKAMTVNGAEIAGVADRVGTIEPGKDADLVVMTGDPFDIESEVYMTIIDGKVVYKRC